MTASWEANLPQEFTFPATVGLIVVLVTVIVLFAISSRSARKLFGGKGTKYVVDEDGAHVVRRSTRSTKKPSRFEPVLHGQGETPSKDTPSPLERVTPRASRTPKGVVEKVAEAVKSATSNDTPTGSKRGPGRPRKTPHKDAASPPTSPMRTRRGTKSPK